MNRIFNSSFEVNKYQIDKEITNKQINKSFLKANIFSNIYLRAKQFLVLRNSECTLQKEVS